MAHVTVTSTHLEVVLAPVEKFFGLRGDLSVPIEHVREVRVVEDPFEAVVGVRAPGLALPGHIRIGTWRNPARKSFVVARRKQAAIHVSLQGYSYTDIVISTPAAEDVADQLRRLSVAGAGARIQEREVRFSSGQFRLAGTFAAPAEARAAVLLIPGSGEVDRNSDHRKLPLDVTRHLAHDLANCGLASLRYDKRGVGESDGTFPEAGFHDNTADAKAALAELRRLLPGLPVLVVGHSEGGLHAVEIAAEDQDLAGVVLLATPGTKTDVTMRWQAKQIVAGLPPFTTWLLKTLRIDILAQQSRAIDKISATTADVTRMQGRRINAKWQREFLAYDPEGSLRRITAPVLAITGGKDIQVDPDDLEIIRELVPAPVETERPEDLTHLLRDDANKPSLSAYKRLIKQPTSAEVLAAVGEWLAARSYEVNAS